MIVDNQVKAANLGAIDAVMSTMKTHMNDPGVCEYGSDALWNLMLNNGKKVSGQHTYYLNNR